MRITFIQKQAALAVSCALALGIVSAPAGAQDVDEHALLLDGSGQHVMSGMGLCVHSGFGPAPAWTAGCHAARPAPVAQYVAPREAAPVAVAGASAAVYEKVVFDANVLFDSNKSELAAAGRDTLDQFVAKISGLDSQSVMAVGYADRMGTEGANQILSEERVGAVKAYLVSKGVAEDRVKTSGWGETRPTTRRADCEDANNAKNVACMQPDRHVSIEISGTRLAQ
ncbi:MAG TPA: OmpA family protein [Burkholderiales bacterium]|nr:OmpA family protein [Burkholderiales bacterium]